MIRDFDLSQSKALNWLLERKITAKNRSITNLFEEEHNRLTDFVLTDDDLYADFSKNNVSKDELIELIELCEESSLKDAIQAQFGGSTINQTEGRPVLHTALRLPRDKQFDLEGQNIVEDVHVVLDRMRSFCDRVINGSWKGYSGKPIKSIVNIGIGGSDLGPCMAVEALAHCSNHLDVHFVSNVDGWHLTETLAKCDADSTLFVIVSKTFTTQETMANANSAKNWLINELGSEAATSHHFVAVSTNLEGTSEFGIDADNTFGFWDWVGGRYSMWSAVGMSIALSIGFDNFESMLAGAHEMDNHFRSEPFAKNVPVMMALMGVWYNNVLGYEAQAILPYDQRLSRFPAYLQQADMESNGKGVLRSGQPARHATGQIIWGEPGTNGQHAFYQLIHQGTRTIPADFIAFRRANHELGEQHQMLLANCIAQGEALMIGKDELTVRKELEDAGMNDDQINFLLPHKVFEGNRPSTTFLFDELTPNNLGKLVAMYEHKIFVQGVLWGVFSYDQWGVELGKKLANKVLEELKSNDLSGTHDDSTSALIEQIRR